MNKTSNQRIKTVSNRIAQAIWRLAKKDGLSFDEFSRFTGISEQALLRPQGRTSRDNHRRVVLLAKDLLPTSPPSMADRLVVFPELGTVWCNSPSMRVALQSYLQYRDVLGELDTVHYQEFDCGVRFEYRPDDHDAIGETSTLANFMLLVDIARNYSVDAKTTVEIELAGGIDRRWRVLGEKSAMALHGEAGRYTLTFRSEVLDRAYQHHNPILDAHARSLLDKELLSLRQLPTFSSRVRQTLHEVLENDDFALSDESMFKCSCDRLGMSRWTVQRYLQNEGLSFSTLRRQMRIDEACRLLNETDLPLTQIGERLGFCSQSSFTRFFSGHFGQSPARYRKRT